MYTISLSTKFSVRNTAVRTSREFALFTPRRIPRWWQRLLYKAQLFLRRVVKIHVKWVFSRFSGGAAWSRRGGRDWGRSVDAPGWSGCLRAGHLAQSSLTDMLKILQLLLQLWILSLRVALWLFARPGGLLPELPQTSGHHRTRCSRPYHGWRWDLPHLACLVQRRRHNCRFLSNRWLFALSRLSRKQYQISNFRPRKYTNKHCSV